MCGICEKNNFTNFLFGVFFVTFLTLFSRINLRLLPKHFGNIKISKKSFLITKFKYIIYECRLHIFLLINYEDSVI